MNRADRRRVLLFTSVFLVAGAGLAYQLIAGTMATYLLGNSVTQFSFATGWFLASMGLGSWLSRWARKNLLETFVALQIGLALVGGFSAAIMFLLFANTDSLYPVFMGLALFLGGSIGMEIPLILRIVGKYRITRLAVSDVFTWDYLGALVASLVFPLIVLPELGLIRGSIFFGFLNILSAGIAWTLLEEPAVRRRHAVYLGSAGVLLFAGFIGSEKMTRFIEEQLYQDPIVLTRTTPYQRIVVTRWKDDTRLYLNGKIQFSSRDEARYHESITHIPVAMMHRTPRKVLILGGGDGMVVRELLKYPDIGEITVVDLDDRMLKLFREHHALRKLNGDALNSKRVVLKPGDGFSFIGDRKAKTKYDLIIADLPDPYNYSLGKLYTVTFYLRVLRRLNPGGLFVTQATSPSFGTTAFWSIRDTIDEACERLGRRRAETRCDTRPFHVYVPSFGDWGFIMAGRRLNKVIPRKLSRPTRFLNDAVLAKAFVFPRDVQPGPGRTVNRLNDQALVRLYKNSWERWFD